MTDMRHHTELSFVDEFTWVSPLHCLKNGWQNAVLLWCMLQAGPPSLHYYCAVVLRSRIVLPPVGHSSNHQFHCRQLTRQSSCVSIFYRTFKLSLDSPSYKKIMYMPRRSLDRQQCTLKEWTKIAIIRKFPKEKRLTHIHSRTDSQPPREGRERRLSSPEPDRTWTPNRMKFSDPQI